MEEIDNDVQIVAEVAQLSTVENILKEMDADKNTTKATPRRKRVLVIPEIANRPVRSLHKHWAKVYNHFTWNEETRQWICNYCPKHCYNHAGRTSSLVWHIQNNHSNVVDVNSIKDKRGPRIKDIDANRLNRPMPKPNHLQNITENVYNHFVWEEELQQFRCIHCSKLCKSSRSTILFRHTKRMHNAVVAESINSFSNKKTAAPDNEVSQDKVIITKKTLGNALLPFIIKQSIPLSIVDSVELRKLFNYCTQANPYAELPDHLTTQNLIGDVFAQEQNALKTELQEAPSKISFAIDGWTLNSRVHYQSVVASWIDVNWKLNNCTLDLIRLEGFPTGENIANTFCKTLNDYGLWRKLLAVTTESASKMDIFFKELDNKCHNLRSSNYRVRCFAQIINRVCKAILHNFSSATTPYWNGEKDDDGDAPMNSDGDSVRKPLTTNIISKIRNLVAAIHDSSQRENLLKEFCYKLHVEYKPLVMDTSGSSSSTTRWILTLTMLIQVVELKRPLIATKEHLPKHVNFRLENSEWDNIEKLIEILEPFRQATNMIAESSSVTISDTAAVQQFLLGHLHLEKYVTPAAQTRKGKSTKTILGKTVNNLDDWLTNAAASGKSLLEAYYSTSDGLVSIVSTVMDPRCKLQYFKGIGWNRKCMDSAKEAITTLLNTKYKTSQTETDENGPTNPTSTSHTLFQKMYERNIQICNKDDDDELCEYLSEPIVNPSVLLQPHTHGALGWWKNNESKFPNLARMARDFLAVSGSVAAVKRLLFGSSQVPDLCTSNTQTKDADAIRMCMCLKTWLNRKESREGEHQVIKANCKEALEEDGNNDGSDVTEMEDNE